ncbi:hypothetical protein DV735_g3932, partial [Chaetothyriales sp. CBS 134920]
MDLAPLAQCAASLSRRLTTIGHQCEHVETRGGIMDIANDILRLSSTLWQLRQDVNGNKDQFTQVFEQDLDELSSELKLVCDEIAECCSEMQKMDSPGPVPWFFKKGRVSKLQKHLAALRTTLFAMRTVLHNSKHYRLQSSRNDLAEINPHVLREDRAALDSILVKNQIAIQELYDLEDDHQLQDLQSALLPVAEIETAATDKNENGSTPLICNDLVAAAAASACSTPPADGAGAAAGCELKRRFSARGARLAIHTSIIGMAPPDLSAGLSERWLHGNSRVQAGAKTGASEPLDYSIDAKHPWGAPSTVASADGGEDNGCGDCSGGGGDATANMDKGEDMPATADQDQTRDKGRRGAIGSSLKRLSSPAQKLLNKLSLRRLMPNTKGRACDGEAQVTA